MKHNVNAENVAPVEEKRITVSKEEFNKRVQMEKAFLTYLEYMPEEEARRKAITTISDKYRVG